MADDLNVSIPSDLFPGGGSELARAIAVMHRRTTALNARAAVIGPDAPLARALAELQTSLEELRVADEELTERTQALATARDLTELERQRYRELFDFAPDAYLVTDLDGLIQEANAASGGLLRLPPAYLAGKPLGVYVAQDDRAGFRRGLLALRQHGRATEWEVRLRPRGGPALPVALTVAVVRDRDDRAVGLRWLIRDISERKRAEAALRALATELEERVAARTAELAAALARERQARAESEQLAAERAAILQHIADGVITADPEGRVTFVNAAARRLLGLADDATPAGVATLPGVAGLADAARGEAVAHAELAIERPGGGRAALAASAAPVRTAEGAPLGAVLTLHDVTPERELERQKDEFLATISHDLRTPLTSIKAAIDIIQDHAPAIFPEPLRRLCVTIDVAADRMTRLVSDLLDLTNVQAGRLRLHRRPCDLTAVARRAAAVIEPLARTRGQRLLLDLPGAPAPATVDAGRVEQVLVNLLHNAHRHGRDGGTIRLSLASGADGARLAVADDGPGIPADEQARIFDRFYRGRQPGSPGGSGLGLAIARALVELHGGRIGVDSRLGQGATFRIDLPGCPAPDDPPEESR